MLNYPFMQNAFAAGTLIAIVSGIVGVFVVARNMSFLTHTLSEIGFAGAAFGLFVGWTPLAGMLLFTSVSSVAVGQLSSKASRREAAITSISALAIGLGILFLSLSNQNASSATNILFGSVIGISRTSVVQVAMLALAVIVVIMAVYRSLKFDSFDAVGARVAGIHGTTLAIIFLVALAFSVSVAAQIVGSLLIFILLTLPASAAKYFAHGVGSMIGLAILFALIGVWLGLALSYWTNWPVSFFIAVIEVLFYFIGLIFNRFTARN
ncbi:MAG: metal ABC transporter permease [Furfurilactobacillus sp.]|jgi:zinc/manganese transport system permease protein|uniref:Metal ABC transporter permease n=1 Tax=Furfurilactobacillus milii TaxID=2888272 RepID=A0ABT6D7J6_9LACO|nr:MULTISPECIES: metal ABC transporter permease [Furfurilactobacillus]QLE65946.1 Zinc ABC transporter inner membrane permease protein ZnuB [Furfurilactobacillus rossiae]MCF6160148.1 metal ABC transporter permease [Furfurilactobacillus milii]MCF6162091.1 metal ABC transporter permease [Furfurilactobacillus milii]MCF6420322.1 metal ABC transporter permease [Furfurilactobacillus milii]MCH4012467.1 metal ABC transporter permease [Furfurilactobacillus sp.]